MKIMVIHSGAKGGVQLSHDKDEFEWRSLSYGGKFIMY